MRYQHSHRLIPLSILDKMIEGGIGSLKELLADQNVQKWDRYNVLILLDKNIRMQQDIKKRITELKECFSDN
jgi:hypothetical protein